MGTVICNETANKLVRQGWKDGFTLEHMKTVLQEEGFMVNPFAILKTWAELDEQKELLENWR